MRNEGGQFLKHFVEPELFDNQQYAEQKTPYDEVPGSAVPETGEHPYNEYVAQPFEHRAAVAAEGDVDVISEEASEGHVPAAPELGNAL